MFLLTNYTHCILQHAVFEEAFTMKGGNFTKHILMKCPYKFKKKKKTLYLWPKWHLTGVENFNIDHWAVRPEAMIGENRQLVTDEPVEFEK